MSRDPVHPEEFWIEEAKVVGYLLDPTHVEGGAKCKFLLAFGFSRDDPLPLMHALGSHPAPDRLARAYAVPRGFKLHFEGRAGRPTAPIPTCARYGRSIPARMGASHDSSP